MLLFLVGNVLGGSVTGVYAEEMYKPASEEGVIVEQAADVPDMEAYEPEPNEDRTVKKKNVQMHCADDVSNCADYHMCRSGSGF